MMSMSNFWDPINPGPGYTEVTEKRRFVSLHIYVFPDLILDDNLKNKIKNQVERASTIWCTQCKIEVFASTLVQLNENNPGELNLDIERTKVEDIPQKFIDMLRKDYRTGCNDTEIAVYYTKGQKFVNAGANSWWGLSNTPGGITLMSEGATGEVLAHEIGHILFVREDPIGSGNFFDTNPDPAGVYDPNDPTIKFDPVHGHDKRADYLMNSPTGPGEIKISPIQCNVVTTSSKLIKSDNVLIGFDPTIGMVRTGTVTFEILHIDDIHPLIGIIDSFRTKWEFYVSTSIPGQHPYHIFGYGQTMDIDGNQKDYNLTTDIPPMDFEIKDVTSNLKIEVGGTEWRLLIPMKLPSINITHDQSDNWGQGLHNVSAQNEILNYRLVYKIEATEPIPFRFPNRECKALVE